MGNQSRGKGKKCRQTMQKDSRQNCGQLRWIGSSIDWYSRTSLHRPDITHIAGTEWNVRRQTSRSICLHRNRASDIVGYTWIWSVGFDRVPWDHDENVLADTWKSLCNVCNNIHVLWRCLWLRWNCDGFCAWLGIVMVWLDQQPKLAWK